MNKIEKSQKPVGLFKIKDHLNYLQGVVKTIYAPYSSVFIYFIRLIYKCILDDSISSRGEFTQKLIDK